MSKQTFVIVGASLAGAKAAQELRERGFDGRVVLIGTEDERPYERPPLSKDYLRGESERDKAHVHPADYYEQHDIELMTGTTVTAIDPDGSQVTLDGGRELAYDKLLLTTGSEPRRISAPGAELEGIYYLRSLADCDMLRRKLDDSGRVAVVGAGWIGSEFAASARQLGLDVTVIDPLALPNERIFGPEIGSFYRDVHVQHGVEMLLDQGLEAFEGDGSRRARAHDRRQSRRVRLRRGRNRDHAAGAARGRRRARGRQRDRRQRAAETSAPGIFAAGDVANAWHPFYEQHVRVEHWANALNQGPAAARAMLGEDVSYDRIPYFFSDQYDVGMEYSGYATSWDQVVFRGDRDGGEFIAFWLSDGRVVGGMNVNVWDVNQHVQELIRSRRVVDVAALTDASTPLDSLVAEPTA